VSVARIDLTQERKGKSQQMSWRNSSVISIWFTRRYLLHPMKLSVNTHTHIVHVHFSICFRLIDC